jgi:hypothetical protein
MLLGDGRRPRHIDIEARDIFIGALLFTSHLSWEELWLGKQQGASGRQAIFGT